MNDSKPVQHQAQVPEKLPPSAPPELQRLDPRTLEVAQEYFSLQARFHSGPLPPADELQGYENASEGAAAQLIQMARDEQKARHYCMRAEVDAIKRGQLCAIAAYISTIGSCVWIVYLGASGVAGTIGAAAISVFGGAFLLNRHLDRKGGKNAEPTNESRSVQVNQHKKKKN